MRILAATNRNLEDEVAAGRFREDLYYRLNVIQLELPPLRERMEDLPLLVHHFVEKYARELGKPVRGRLGARRWRACARTRWPGNVRELENGIERAVALSRGEWIEAGGAAADRDGSSAGRARAARLLDGQRRSRQSGRGLRARPAARRAERSGGVKKRAAQFLGITFRSFRYRLEKLGLDDDPGDRRSSERAVLPASRARGGLLAEVVTSFGAGDARCDRRARRRCCSSTERVAAARSARPRAARRSARAAR